MQQLNKQKIAVDCKLIKRQYCSRQQVYDGRSPRICLWFSIRNGAQIKIREKVPRNRPANRCSGLASFYVLT